MEVLEEKMREGQETYLKTFPTWGMKQIQVQEEQRVQNKMNSMRSTLRYIIIKMSNVKDKVRILKAAR